MPGWGTAWDNWVLLAVCYVRLGLPQAMVFVPPVGGLLAAFFFVWPSLPPAGFCLLVPGLFWSRPFFGESGLVCDLLVRALVVGCSRLLLPAVLLCSVGFGLLPWSCGLWLCGLCLWVAVPSAVVSWLLLGWAGFAPCGLGLPFLAALVFCLGSCSCLPCVPPPFFWGPLSLAVSVSL